MSGLDVPNRPLNILWLLAACVICVVSLAPSAHGQEASLGKASHAVPPLLQQMVGTWDVQQRMWLGPETEASNLPPAVARRRLVEGAYLEEIMNLAQESGPGPFTRTAYVNYNAVSQRFEYFSLDSRAPQMMSYEAEGTKQHPSALIKFRGGRFVASQWGEAKNVAFEYRLTVGEVNDNQQVVQLYLTPQSGPSAKEFLAFEYVYTRQR